ncbi:unnamed protein product [Polarella glacialis]|uniref:PPPDE domain-containing protein n=1 Tax=Polarella glacialis TaxID=89957 RepID=A0A813J6Q3_POLGL|nr:unnamed protein product [Polarella glacialis]
MARPVTLNIYDVSGHPAVRNANQVLRALGSGAYHGAVEIDGREWSFGGADSDETGVFCCEPRGCEAHAFRESIPMGHTALSPAQVQDVLTPLTAEWRAKDYDLLRVNCCHFSNSFCVALGVGPIPPWVLRSAKTGASVVTPVQNTVGEGKLARGASKEDHYQFGDFSRGLANSALAMGKDTLAKGKETRGASSGDGYKVGDLSRGLLAKLPFPKC